MSNNVTSVGKICLLVPFRGNLLLSVNGEKEGEKQNVFFAKEGYDDRMCFPVSVTQVSRNRVRKAAVCKA